jgi:hypothetical protein
MTTSGLMGMRRFSSSEPLSRAAWRDCSVRRIEPAKRPETPFGGTRQRIFAETYSLGTALTIMREALERAFQSF